MLGGNQFCAGANSELSCLGTEVGLGRTRGKIQRRKHLREWLWLKPCWNTRERCWQSPEAPADVVPRGHSLCPRLGAGSLPGKAFPFFIWSCVFKTALGVWCFALIWMPQGLFDWASSQVNVLQETQTPSVINDVQLWVGLFVSWPVIWAGLGMEQGEKVWTPV